MRTFLFTLLTAISIGLHSQVQCYQDSLPPHYPLLIHLDADPPDCWEPNCPITSCHYSQMSDTGSFVVNFGNAGGMFNVVVLEDCRWVVADTCVFIGNTTPSFEFRNYFNANSTLMVCGDPGAAVLIFAKPVPSMNFRPFRAPMYDLDTICGTMPTGGIEPIQVGNTVYLRFDTWQVESRRPLPTGLYFEVDETFVGHGRIVRVFDF